MPFSVSQVVIPVSDGFARRRPRLASLRSRRWVAAQGGAMRHITGKRGEGRVSATTNHPDAGPRSGPESL